MAADFQSVRLRPNETLRYWRLRDLRDATLVQARYGPFRWEKHVHEEQVVVIPERGSGQVVTRHGSDVGGPGTIWVFSPGEYHFGRVDRGREWHYRALYLDQSALDAVTRHLGFESGRLLLKRGLHFDPELSGLLLRAQAQRADRLTEQVAWNEVLAKLFARYGDPRPRLGESDFAPARLQAAREFMSEHSSENISIDDLAQLVELSRYHFIRAFRTAFGLPPHAYLNQLRVQHARKLLIAGHTATQAAIESGFYDQSKLNHLFKRAYGTTPSRYARLAKL